MAEALDIEQPDALLGYLRRAGYVAPDERLAMRVLGGGVSNRTVLVERASGEAWVLKQALAKLRVAVDWFGDPMRIHREAAGLRWLARLAPPGATTPLIFEDHQHHLLAMRAVPPRHDNWKTLLLAGRLEAGHVAQFGRLLGTIHRAAAGCAEVAAAFDDRSFFASLRLEPYYGYAAGRVPPAAGFLDDLVAETLAERATLVHGDFSPKNILLHDGTLVLLDHEVIHYGDPAFDLGFSLAHLLSKAHHLADHRAAFAGAADDYWSSYRRTVGDAPWAVGLEARAVRHTLGCLLARVAGRSPLEYLSDAARARQRAAVVALMADPPGTVADLVAAFIARV